MSRLTRTAIGLLAATALWSACATAGTAINTGTHNTATSGNATVNVILGGEFVLPPPEKPCRREVEASGRAYDQDNFLGAVAQGQQRTVESFLQCGIPLDTRSEQGHRTALMLAALYGHLDVVSLLLDHGANVNDADEKGWTPLMLAAGNGSQHKDQRRIVELLLEKNADVGVQSTDGWSALSLAARAGAEDVVAVLIKGGADAKGLDATRGLLAATTLGHLGAAEALLAGKLDADMTLEGRPTPWATATWKADRAMQCLLLRYGAVPKAQDLGGLEPAAWQQANCLRGIQIASDPPGATVRRNSTTDFVVGKTPIADAGLATAPTRLEFLLDGYEPLTLAVDARQAAQQPIKAVLRKGKGPPPTREESDILVWQGGTKQIPTPIYKKWWLWTAVGVAVSAIVIGAAAGTASQGAGGPPADLELHDPKWQPR